MRTSTLLLDIEGTTTPISFVYQVLFPYARAHVEQFLGQHAHDPEIQSALEVLKSENLAETSGEAPPVLDPTKPDYLRSAAAYCLWLMSLDRKSTPLKTIQGRIWQEGFLCGDLRGEVFADVPPAFQRWHGENRKIAIYSSGSVLAQQLLFGYSRCGNLASYISFFFDTQTGPKRAVSSYLRIQEQMQCRADETLFVSDVLEEIEAARQAGFHTALSVRPGNPAIDTSGLPCQVIRSFDELMVDRSSALIASNHFS